MKHPNHIWCERTTKRGHWQHRIGCAACPLFPCEEYVARREELDRWRVSEILKDLRVRQAEFTFAGRTQDEPGQEESQVSDGLLQEVLTGKDNELVVGVEG